MPGGVPEEPDFDGAGWGGGGNGDADGGAGSWKCLRTVDEEGKLTIELGREVDGRWSFRV